MSRKEFKENIGEIAVLHDECFWIFPKRYIYEKYCDLYSPWFSFFKEKWRFIMALPNNEYDKVIFFLWRKFRHDLRGYKYILKLILKTHDGRYITFSEEDSSYCDFGFKISDFCCLRDLKDTRIADCELIKIFFFLKKTQISSNDVSCASSGRKEEDEDTSEDEENNTELTSDDEMTSDEDNNRSLSNIKGIKILSENLKQVLLDGVMSDAILKVDGREFKVHKVILSARSAVFASMFQHDFEEKQNNVVDIPDCTAESFEVFLHYMYTGTAETLSINRVYNVYYAADKYQVDDLKKMCIQFIINNMSVETFCDGITLALSHGESRLQCIAIDFFSQNVRKIIRTVQWQKYMASNSVCANELLITALGDE